jgi:creatinine amidohydrolase
MKFSDQNGSRVTEKVLWSELLPYEFKRRMAACPIVYLPLGLCEPHGQISAFGLDTIKAEWLCLEAARRVGGIVAPTMGYQIHESGYHARWLEETVGEENPHMTAIPTKIYLTFFLYQLRAFVNAGFQHIIVVSGHSGGNQEDLRTAAKIFMQHVPVTIWIKSDPELVEGIYKGDHAGKYEISQLLYLRPELIDFSAIDYEAQSGSGGRLALGHDWREANPEMGEEIMEACLERVCSEATRWKQHRVHPQSIENINYDLMEKITQELMNTKAAWITNKPNPKQQPVSPNSQWKRYEYVN